MGVLTAVEPVAAAFLGIAVFGEHLRAGAAGITATVAGALVTIFGVLLVTSGRPGAADDQARPTQYEPVARRADGSVLGL